MESLSQIAKRFLNRAQSETSHWEAIPEAVELSTFVYNGGIWVADYKSRIHDFRAKKPEDMGVDEIYAYLTAVVAQERIWGSFGCCLKDGTLDKLLTRYLELAKKN